MRVSLPESAFAGVGVDCSRGQMEGKESGSREYAVEEHIGRPEYQ